MKNKLVVVTNLGGLKAYRYETTLEGTPRLELVEEVVLEEARRRFDETVTDMAGRRTGPTHAAWGAPIADDRDLRLEYERRLIKRLAGHIEEIIQRNEYDVWLAAPEEINRQILDELPESVRPRIKKNLSRDLTKADQKELLKHFLGKRKRE